MAPLQDSSSYLKKVLLLKLFLIFITSTLISAHSQNQPQNHDLYGTRKTRMLLELEDQDQDQPIIKKKPSILTTTGKTTKIPTKNQTKLIKPSSSTSSKNQTNLIKPKNGPFKNQTKLIKPPSDSSKNKTKLTKTSSVSTKDSSEPKLKSQIKKLNSTSNSTTKLGSFSTKKSSDLPKLSSSKNKTTKTKTFTSKETKAQIENTATLSKSKKPTIQPSWSDQDDEEDDLVSEFRDLPSKFQETFVPDLERISKTSRIYLTRYNKEFTKNFKPYVGNKYAATIASFTSFAFIIIPLILVSLIFNRITAYFSLQKLLIFIQVYLAIYFTILGLSSLVTGLEPLKFFYSSSQNTYVCVQVLQTLAYVLYLLLLLMYLVLVFSTETGLATKLLGLGQTFVGFAVGLHYYITVFHRAVLHQPPKSSWKVHCLYATCFLVICLLGRIDRRKKAYLEEGGEEGKKS